MDELIDEYAKILQEIYDNQTAGDFTFLGVLAEFTSKAKVKLGVFPN